MLLNNFSFLRFEKNLIFQFCQQLTLVNAFVSQMGVCGTSLFDDIFFLLSRECQCFVEIIAVSSSILSIRIDTFILFNQNSKMHPHNCTNDNLMKFFTLLHLNSSVRFWIEVKRIESIQTWSTSYCLISILICFLIFLNLLFDPQHQGIIDVKILSYLVNSVLLPQAKQHLELKFWMLFRAFCF